MKSINKHLNEINKKGPKELWRKIYTFLFYGGFHLLQKFFFIIFLAYNYSKTKNKTDIGKNNKKILIGTIVWGNLYNDYLINFLIPSLFSKNNIIRLILDDFDVEYIFVLEKNENLKLQITNIILLKLKKFNIDLSKIKLSFEEKSVMNKNKMSQYLLNIFKKSYKEKSILFYTNADHIFSDGTLYNFTNMIDTNNCVIATATFGVNKQKFIDHYKNNSFSNNNKELIKITRKYFHQSIIKSFKDHPVNMSWGSGVVIEKLFDNNLLITFSLPSPFMFRVTKSDIDFFNKYDFNVFDHSWPSKLMMQQRLRVVPSSEVAFVVEIRDDEKDTPTDTPLELSNTFIPLRHITRRRLHTVLLSSFTYFLKIN
ncbi:MAG: hypothetical protein CMI90_06000 [Pelagibacteraceae bacterium]|nr:hypothetical protein [Pelagibacteraceae bacterium]